MAIKLDPSLDIIAVRESLKHWLINRFSLVDYAKNRDPVVGNTDNLRCINDTGRVCTEGDPNGVFRAIKSPGVHGKDKLCNATYCVAWCPTNILDRAEFSSTKDRPPRLILLDWMDRSMRNTGLYMLQVTIISTNISSDPGGYLLMSLRNAFVEALNLSTPPTAQQIPLYRRSKRGHVRFLESHKTKYVMAITPFSDERMQRQTFKDVVQGDRSSFIQQSNVLGSFIFTFHVALCQATSTGGAFN